MLKLSIRLHPHVNTTVLYSLGCILLTTALPNVVRSQSQCPASLCATNFNVPADAIIGWDGDHDAVYANMDGTYYIRDGKCITVGFSVYNNPPTLQWYNEAGYLPCLTTQ